MNPKVSIIRVTHLPNFHLGEDAVLLAMDTAGLDALTAALEQTRKHGAWRLEHQQHTHHLRVQAGAADLELHDDRTEWQLDPARITEMTDKLAAMRNSAGPCHHYVDISTPADTLVLSLGEYTESTWLA